MEKSINLESKLISNFGGKKKSTFLSSLFLGSPFALCPLCPKEASPAPHLNNVFLILP